MAIEHAEKALNAAELLLEATCFQQSLEALMCATHLMRKALPGMRLTLDLSNTIDSFNARTLALRSKLRSADALSCDDRKEIQ